ncbi:MAG: ATP-binding cassette domain-containing protein [Thermoanaerobaculia bacterium]|nr:ATP-binding cassette domain-containing protein [Thermoanaerobaculia bacterium]
MLLLDHVTRRFGSLVAVDDVTFAIDPGEIVGLVGENGAGKSTLMRIAAGETSADAGTIRTRSIGFVHQHFALVPRFTIAENLALRRRFGLVSKKRIERLAEETIAASGIELTRVDRLAADLSVGEKAKLELIKAIATKPELLVLDEPTSVLTPIESAELFGVIRRLAATGTAIVFISHKVPEVLAIAQRIVVMRRGRIVEDRMAGGRTAEDIARAMLNLSDSHAGELTRRAGAPAATQTLLHLDNLTLRASEIVAIIGVSGNGQSAIVEAIHALHLEGAAFIPEDRTRDALVAEMTIAENLALGAPRWNRSEAGTAAVELIRRYGIRARGPNQLAAELSGGNQQKVVLARALERNPEIIIASEPTRGLDIESTRFVHERLRDAAANGAAILLTTSDLDEAFALSDRVHVIYRGELSASLTPEEAERQAGALMAGIA